MHDVAKHDDNKAQYFWVWGALLVLTAIEVVLAYKQVFEAVRMLEILLILSVIKSALIIGYFMHLKFETAIMRWMITISVVACFIIMYFFFFPDAGRINTLGVHQAVLMVRKSGIATLFLAMALWSAPAVAQGCAMCRANAKATPKEGQRAINGAILVMLVPPIGMITFGTGFIVRYVRRRDREKDECE